MDDIVKQALAKWPNVPDCFGWLGLDARGRWYLRDEATQAMGDFAHCKGDLLEHEKLIAFIGRNYAADAQGQWFFQNGPQRVYVELEVAPWVWRLQADFSAESQTQQAAQVQDCYVDEQGRVYLLTQRGFGIVHSWDVPLVAKALEQGRWEPQSVQAQALPALFGYELSPLARQAPKS